MAAVEALVDFRQSKATMEENRKTKSQNKHKERTEERPKSKGKDARRQDKVLVGDKQPTKYLRLLHI